MRLHFLLLAIILLGSLFIGSDAGSVNVSAQKKAAPFGVDKRPQPSGANLELLLPKTVGAFKRGNLPAGAKPRADEDLNVEYRTPEGDTISFGFSLPDTEKDAAEAVEVTRREAAIDSRLSVRGEHYVTGRNPSYFKIDDFMSWTRGRYFFYAKASSPQALERFMKAFPY